MNTEQVEQYNQYFTLVSDGKAVPIYIDDKGADGQGLKLVTQSFAGDVALVTGVKPAIITDMNMPCEQVIIAGTIGSSSLIDELIEQGKLHSAVMSKREAFQITVIEQPFANIGRAIVIAGADKRGTFYGLYHISGLIGVSPWVYWGDVKPAQTGLLRIPLSELNYCSKQPSIKYRGFFLNDEWPSLGSWAMNHCGGFNEHMYKPIFELVLRLKGNYLWPAMWSAVFSEDGQSYPLANAELADAYGIVMGTSHHEPLFRAGEEWQKTYEQYADSNEWDFDVNRQAITRFWEDGVIRNRSLESVITLGMRGERDSELGGTLEKNIDRLKDVIMTQKQILQKHGLGNAPQMLVVYKEVEKFWHGTEQAAGLKHWDVLKDVTIMLSDDNFGNMRTLPQEDTKERDAGWGIYYHFDYHGGPRSYEWVNTTPLEKVWEQMTMAHDYGIRDIWIVNVGDLKPNELPLSYFMELAYDFESWGTDNPNRTEQFLQNWTRQQFAHVADETTLAEIAQILADYTRMNGARKPEVTYPDTYSFTQFKEAERVLEQAIFLEQRAEACRSRIPAAHKDAYDQLVYFPAVASANVQKMNIDAGLNQLYSQSSPPSRLANRYAALVEQAIERDCALEKLYNEEISGGKWRGMMSSPHIGYVNWNADGWQYPQVHAVQPAQGTSMMIVHPEGSTQGIIAGSGALPEVNQLQRQQRKLTISNGGDTPFQFEIESDASWLNCQPYSGLVEQGTEIVVSVDWQQLQASETGTLKIVGAGQCIEVQLIAELLDTSLLPAGAFIEAAGIVAIEAEHTVQRCNTERTEWRVLEHYGKTLSTIKLFPSTASFEQPQHAPYVEYLLHTTGSGEYQLTLYMAPSNPLTPGSRLRYAVAFDRQEPVIAAALSDEFAAGESKDWEQGVLNNAHQTTTVHHLSQGTHTLRIYHLDAGMALQKLVLSRGGLADSFFGPPESYRHEGDDR